MTIEISAVTRAAKGTGASRRLRREAKGQVLFMVQVKTQ